GENDEVLVVMESGKVVRSTVSEVPARGRDTMGVIFAKPGPNDTIVGVARNAEREIEKEVAEEDAADATGPGGVVVAETDVAADGSVPEAEEQDGPASDAQNDAVALEDNDNGGDA
ncbi:MAG: DNA gyrase subunit A, partial [Micrococcaceae bacterium]|nr:DNA gyrase subunit A [Micrococcaceae bacterium]